MKHSITIFFVVFSILFANAQSDLSITNAEVSFVFVNNDVEGTLEGFTSESIIDLDQIENSKLKGSVKVETISTGNSIRNWSLRRSKYFDADNFPKIKFESTSVQQEGDIITVKGKLTIKDVAKDVNFSFKRKDKQLVGKTTLYSSDYGINIKSDREKNKVLVELIFQLK
ncbi:YceI family protein [Maribacter sp. 2308TA10-17]|uniref:YceI family protein n=1 Tax=Maribacter sp. 2308TA10-17 TaxID=3386276 RepID=UPI0039BCB73E